MSTPLVLDMNQWNPASNRYMQPRINDRGLKSITVISTQSNRSLYLSLPLMMCWGISDFVDEKTGESDGKYNISLQFPRDSSPESEKAIQKLKEFENQLIEDAVKNSEAWFGRKQTREITEFSYFPFLKYSKNKDTKMIDNTRPPTLRPKVPCFNGVWKVEIYDPKGEMLFPCENQPGITPIDFVPKQSQVISVIQCGGVWVGGKGWGLTWKLVQCVVKPQVMVTPFGRLHIKLSDSDIETMSAPVVQSKEVEDPTFVEDSDEEEPEKPAPVVKKIVKKVTKPAEPEVKAEVAQPEVVEPDVVEPDVVEPEVVESDVVEPEVEEEKPKPVIVKKKIIKKVAK